MGRYRYVNGSNPDVQSTEVIVSNVTVVGTISQGYLRNMAVRIQVKWGDSGALPSVRDGR